MDTLPPELIIRILILASRYHRGLISVYRYVCKRWWCILNHNKPFCVQIPKTIGNYICRGYIQPEFILYLRDSGEYGVSDVCLELARLDNQILLKWAMDHGFMMDARIFSAPTNIRVVRWIRNNTTSAKFDKSVRSSYV